MQGKCAHIRGNFFKRFTGKVDEICAFFKISAFSTMIKALRFSYFTTSARILWGFLWRFQANFKFNIVRKIPPPPMNNEINTFEPENIKEIIQTTQDLVFYR